ncbi:hypothetical protein ElyMa_005322000 [Elysia marginata]|uniref:Uncharacterized protein n=1 Tax=Elysia marginata TaxID=1093978 RepID=A0AAV4K1V6_9GAST|nr:hypothetical protein ElyMa_005322000 [Elysia marginata]
MSKEIKDLRLADTERSLLRLIRKRQVEVFGHTNRQGGLEKTNAARQSGRKTRSRPTTTDFHGQSITNLYQERCTQKLHCLIGDETHTLNNWAKKSYSTMNTTKNKNLKTQNIIPTV